MEDIVANVDHIYFDIERALDLQLGLQTLPFPGMDKSGAAICSFYLTDSCSKGINCPYRHVRGDKSVVCKHWLRGLCKKGDDCEFLHEFDMEKMPECYFYSRFGECGNKDCPFLHIDPESRIKACPWYDRGFCRHGSLCKNRHVRRVLCINYLCGFCLDGPNCKYIHPRFELPIIDNSSSSNNMVVKKNVLICHYCNEPGHKAVSCPHLIPSLKKEPFVKMNGDAAQSTLLRPLEQVTCFKCGEKGHYANKCPRGHLAFLSNNQK